jgi:hypothetical protein
VATRTCRAGWSLLPLTNRSFFTKSRRAQIFCGLLIALATATLTSCHGANFFAYHFPEFTFANRPIPPSLLAERVMVAVSTNGAAGSLQILDGKRDIRSNVQNTKPFFSVTGSVGAFPNLILTFPAEIRGYVFSSTGGTTNIINYGTEASTGVAPGSPFPGATSLAIPPTFGHIYAAVPQSGQLVISDSTSTAGTYALNIPNVYQVAVNTGDTVVLAMVRNSNAVYRVIKLNVNQYPTAIAAIAAIGAVDCEPLNVPIYCAVPVNTGTTNAFDRPIGAYFSLDGTTAYVLNCGPECGGNTASVTFLQQGALEVNTFTIGTPNVDSFSANVPVPGGVTAALSDGTTLYVSGQQLQPDGLWAGNLSTINLAAVATNPSTAVTAQYSISDGNHTKMLFADDNTLWIGSQFCATGERAHQASLGVATQAANFNCLTRFDLGALTASVVPAVVSQGSAQVAVPFPNGNQNQFYYGDLTGLCWVQNFHKVYTAYGGQVHAFNTVDGSEINNTLIIVQGTALDVAYMDAVTDANN